MIPESYSIENEIERKTVNAFSALASRRFNNDITDDQMKEALKTLWSVSAGLVSEETTNLIQLDEAAFDNSLHREILFCVETGKTVILERNLDQGGIIMITLSKGSPAVSMPIPFNTQAHESAGSASHRTMNNLAGLLVDTKHYVKI